MANTSKIIIQRTNHGNTVAILSFGILLHIFDALFAPISRLFHPHPIMLYIPLIIALKSALKRFDVKTARAVT